MTLTDQDIKELRASYPIKYPSDIEGLNYWLECLEEYEKESEEEDSQYSYIPYSSLNYVVKKRPCDPAEGAATRERMEDLVTRIGRSERRDAEALVITVFIDDCPEIEISEDAERFFLQGFDYKRKYPDHVQGEFHSDNKHRYVRIVKKY